MPPPSLHSAHFRLLSATTNTNGMQDGVSRIHASRRVFDALKRSGSELPVLHHIRFPAGASRDEIVINTGTMVCVKCLQTVVIIAAVVVKADADC
jgi:hypothetical protein